jgi:glycosyltransferase involved in cell wall biosynthesis
MAKINFSIIACTYNNPYHLKNFLWTVFNQDYQGGFETIIVNNASTRDGVIMACCGQPSRINIRYYEITPEEKRCTNIAQGINLAAQKAMGRYLVIVADPNVLLSFNLLSSISKVIKPTNIVLSAGPENDVKISPDGLQQTEYAKLKPEDMETHCELLLRDMGWPCDPLELKLLPGKHRFPPPHLQYDCYIAAMSRPNFYKFGEYPEKQTTWGRYHDEYLQMLAKNLDEIRLTDIRVVHQFHRVFKEE